MKLFKRRGPTTTPDTKRTWACTCGETYRINGCGRHRIYWPQNADTRDAVMDGACVSCRVELPGKRRC